MQILLNISRGKGNQTMKFDQLIEYKMSNTFLEKSYKIKIEHISGSKVQSFSQFVFIVCQVERYQNILKRSCRSLAFSSYKAF